MAPGEAPGSTPSVHVADTGVADEAALAAGAESVQAPYQGDGRGVHSARPGSRRDPDRFLRPYLSGASLRRRPDVPAPGVGSHWVVGARLVTTARRPAAPATWRRARVRRRAAAARARPGSRGARTAAGCRRWSPRGTRARRPRRRRPGSPAAGRSRGRRPCSAGCTPRNPRYQCGSCGWWASRTVNASISRSAAGPAPSTSSVMIGSAVASGRSSSPGGSQRATPSTSGVVRTSWRVANCSTSTEKKCGTAVRRCDSSG